MKYIYLTLTKDGFLYVGKHSWDGEGLDPSYTGSGTRLQSHEISSCQMLEDTSLLTIEEHNQRESYWIEYYAKLYGVVPYFRGEHQFQEFSKYIRPDGKLLNCHSMVSPDRSSGMWCLDNMSPMSLSEISVILTGNKTSVSGRLQSLDIDKESPQAQFFYHGHWIHRPGAVLDTSAPCRNTIDTRYLDPMYAQNRKAAIEKYIHTDEFLDKERIAAMQEWSDPVYREKNHKGKVARRLRYRLQDGFEGDYEEIANHIGYTGKSTRNVSTYLRGAAVIPKAWGALIGATQIL